MKFLPVPDYEGLYEVSDMGVVRSIDRTVEGVDGAIYPYKGRVKTQTINKQTGYPVVSLYKNNKGKSATVHRLVAKAFIPNPDGLNQVNHLDGIKTNNNVDNLEWVTHQDNAIHAVSTGLKTYKNRLTKNEFLECLRDVINGATYLDVSKRVPYKVPFLSTKLRKLAKEVGVEHMLNDSLKQQHIERSRINGLSNKR